MQDDSGQRPRPGRPRPPGVSAVELRRGLVAFAILLAWGCGTASDPEAQYEMGVRYEDRGDLEQALHWYGQSAEQGFPPALHVLGQGDSNYGDANLRKATRAGYAPALAMAARRLYTTGRADDPGARCEELVALQGDAMAQLRTVYRYAEGGGNPETAYFWGRVTLESFGEASSITIDRYILHTLGVLSNSLTDDQQIQQEKRAEAFRPKSFEELKPLYTELGCFG